MSLKHFLNPFRNVPYLYVKNIEEPYHERGIDQAVRYEDNETLNEDLAAIYEATRSMSNKEACDWVRNNLDTLSSTTLVVEDDRIDPIEESQRKSARLIVCLQPFNTIRHFNTFLAKANELLPDGGLLSIFGETSGMRRYRIESEHPIIIGDLVVDIDYFWTRVISKLGLTRRAYMALTRGRDRNFSRVEVLGRVARAGFDICGDEIRGDAYYVCGVRRRDPVTTPPRYGLFVRLPRKGKDGKMIGVYKLRTMFAYSEYIQDYTYRINGLEVGGKLKDDFRVNFVGERCRSRFIDELPMFINFFRGELKLVGVRPLSEHYLSLYTPEMQALHLSVKPGIFPPLYYEYPKPETLEEIMDSERRYIEKYNAHPFRTDWTYFWGMMRNILLRRERSH